MATTTTNFGWDIPQSTDLVKDGATAIAALGQDIDTALVDLKGGTSGQILSKASNTDLDYTWITNDVGDITAVTAGTGITGGGTSGAVTVSFDQANYGGGQFAAGKNKIINGDFGVWQRGTSFSLTTGTDLFCADRFKAQCNFTAGTATASQQTFTAGTAPVAGYEGQYFARIACGSTSTYATFNQKIEDVRTFAGQTITVSAWVRASGTATIQMSAVQSFGTGGSSAVTTYGSSQSLTSSWVRYTQTLTIPSISGKTIGTGSALHIYLEYGGTLGSQNLDMWGVQVEAGSTATPFQTATGTKQGELAACQRYYWRSGGSQSLGVGYVGSTTTFDYLVNLPVPMRAAATFATNSGTSYFYLGVGGGSAGATNSNTFFNSTNMNAVSRFTGTGFTVGQAGIVQTNNAAAYMEASAEL